MSFIPEIKAHYRADIQGLRGIAVLLVVIYHTGFALPGGFVGVDMFFVISGFVITQVLVREYEETGSIRLNQFYVRRARRLIPALSVVVIFTLLISLVAMSPFGEQQQIIKTAIASTFFAGNIHLFAMSTYESLKDNPLRHLWSLGVEEQFYWVYPVFFLVLLRLAKKCFIKVLMLVLSIFAVISFGIGVLLTYGFEFGYTDSSILSSQFAFLEKIGFQPGGDWPTKFAFFGAPARFWEIILGSLTALFTNKFAYKSRTTAVYLLSVGVTLIIWSSFALSTLSSFPGYLALMPTFGTVLLILFNHEIKPINRFFSSQRLVFVGDISYSLYLWHWPFIVFAEAIWPDVSFAALVAAGLSVLPAALSYKFIETHFQRQPKFFKSSQLIVISALLAFPLVISYATYKVANTGLGLPGLGTKQNFATDNDCGDAKTQDFEFKDCTFGSKEAKFSAVLFGDSTARSISDGVFAAVLDLGGKLTISVSGGCKFYASGFEDSKICVDLNKERFEYLRSSIPDVLIINNRQIFENCRSRQLNLRNLIFSETRTEFSENSNRYYSELEETLKIVAGIGIPIVSVEQIPWCGPSEPTLLRPQNDSITRFIDYELPQVYLNKLRDLTLSFSGNQIVRSQEVLCFNSICNYFLDGQPLYADPAHLTSVGSLQLKPALIDAIKKVLEQK